MAKKRDENKWLSQNRDPLVVSAISFGTLFGSLIAAIGGWIGYSALRVDHSMNLAPAIPVAERKSFTPASTGALSYYVSNQSTSGRPLVLIHSINAAASAYEMRPLFEHYRESRPVYALDLPGFGFSDRSNRVYSIRLYTDAIIEFLKTQVGQPADVIALSLGSEFSARAAKEHPELFNSLTLISPSGFTARDRKRASQKANQDGTSNFFHKLFSFPLWSQAFYDLLATQASISYFLKQSFEGKVDHGLFEYDYASTHQPGAKNAPLYFVSGLLFSPYILEEVYQQLTIPALVLYDRDNFVRFDLIPALLDKSPNWQARRIVPTRGLPHFEKLNETASVLDEFWLGVDKQDREP